MAWLDEQEQQAWRAYLSASRLIEDTLDEDLRAHGLQLSEYEILALLSEAQGCRLRMSALAERVIQSRSRLTHTATRLEGRGLVRRRPVQGDRRGIDLCLTQEGENLLERLAPVHVAGVRRHLVDHLGSEGFVRLGAAMAVIRDGIRNDRAPGSSGTTAE